MNGELKDRNDALWAKVMIGFMLTAMSMSILVLGAVGIVSIVNSGSDSSSSASIETVVQVQLSEFVITMVPAVVPPGKVTFTIHNGGTVAHNFALPDLGKSVPLINSGETATLVVDFANEGTFKVLCEVAGHASSGMVSSLTVSAKADSAQVAASPDQPVDVVAGNGFNDA